MQQKRTEELHQILYQIRGRKYRDKKLSFEEFKEKLMSKDHVDPATLKEAGFLDDIDYFINVKSHNVDTMREVIVTLPPGRILGSSSNARANRFDYLLNNRSIVV